MRKGIAFLVMALVWLPLLAACAQAPAASPTAVPKPTAAQPQTAPTAAPQSPAPTTAVQAPAPTAAPKPAAPTAAAQPAPAKSDYPQKAVNVIVPYPPGGPVDGMARVLAEAVKPHFPQPLVVVNRGGAGGNLGTAEVGQAKPDGYTVGITAHPTIALAPYTADLPYKSPDDFTMIINFLDSGYVMGSLTDAPWKDLA